MLLLIEEVPLPVLENFGPNVPEEFGWVGFVVEDRDGFDDFGGVEDVMWWDMSGWWPLVGVHFQAC